MLQYFLVFEKFDPWPHTVEGLLTVVSHLGWFKRPGFRRKRSIEHFSFATALHISYTVDNVDLCSAFGDLYAEERKISNEIV